ncbi:hypothetical protein [Mucilaginibacter sp. dw_454]|uniref:BPSS1187 family protein n=1 Tax=Mucilaginibacter sp. dw_454 TaxID=2720079 RepID=UPI001BD5800F|nr:hypothetical protein [Mucilaginibacter sp. dw_454]
MNRIKLCLFLCLALIFIATLNLSAQPNIIKVMPSATNAAIKDLHGEHIATWYKGKPDAHKLVLMIAGTNGVAARTITLDTILSSMGYHVIALDYPNSLEAVKLANNPDVQAFDNYRLESLTGKPVSDAIEVDSANSILNRFDNVLNYLIKNDPAGNWKQFVKNGKPVWEKIIPAGNSQGAGHAAYIGKMYKVDRVLMFSGPQDYSKSFNAPAPWQAKKGATNASRYFAFLHYKDPYNVHLQLENCKTLMETATIDSVSIKPLTPVVSKNHILVTDVETPNPHGSTTTPQFKYVWQYMLTAPVR